MSFKLKLKLKGNDVIKEQSIEITETMMGIYGYNNSGKNNSS